MTDSKKICEEECIPVGCVPFAAVAVLGGGGVVCSGWGVSAQGGMSAGRWGGVCLPKGLGWCVSAWGGGVCRGGCTPPALLTESQTGVKTLPFCNFVCGW